MISPQCPYNQLGIPLELSPRTSTVILRRLFLPMETEGEFLVSSPGHSEVSTPHIVKEEEDQFPLKGFPYMGSIPISVYWNLPLNYVTLAQLVLGTSSASSLYHNPVWGSGAMPTMAPFISNPTPQQTLILQLLQSRCNPPFRTILYRQSKTPIWCN